MPTRKRRTRGAGSWRQLSTGRYQARFSHDGRTYTKSMDSKAAAIKWLERQANAVHDGTFTAPVPSPAESEGRAPKFADYSEDWLTHREKLAARTRHDYQGMIDTYLVPQFGTHRLDKITAGDVRAWHRDLLPDAPNLRSKVYSLLATIMKSAWREELIEATPCRVEGASSVKRKTKTEVPTPVQVHALADAMGATGERTLAGGKYRALVLVSAWCGLRFGEATELRRKDVVVGDDGLPVRIRVRRAVTRVGPEFVVGPPKSEAGVRDATVPPHIRADLADYLDNLPDRPEVLLFPGSRSGAYLRPSSLYKPFYRAREEVGLPTLRWHDLRHFAGTTAAQTGAPLSEVQGFLGHSTVTAAMRYQHAASDANERIAEAMSNVVPMKRKGA